MLFRHRQGISLNYRGDIHNPHNRSDHVPAHLNTSLFLVGLPPAAKVGDLLRAVAALGPVGRIFAASVSSPDPARGLPLAAAKISFFTRAQAERLKALIDAQQLVMYGLPPISTTTMTWAPTTTTTPTPPPTQVRTYVVRCAWNRDRKAPRQCVQANECRVLVIRGPRTVVNRRAMAAFFDEKFRYELEDVWVLGQDGRGQRVDEEGGLGDDMATGSWGNDGMTEQTMVWRFASFQSQAIAAKMALNQERKMVHIEYGRDPCEWGRF